VLLDDLVAPTSQRVKPGQVIKVLDRARPAAPLDSKGAPVRLEVVYEDECMAAVVKPQGMATMRMGSGNGITADQCIKYALSMPQREGAPL
jgi:23S rRNA-/tRNA-specific pseudouridylate synthase